MNGQNSKLPYAAATITAIIFGFSFLFTKGALDTLDIFQLLGFRFITAALFLTILSLSGLIKVNIGWGSLKKLLIVAFFQPILYFICETIGVNLTTASEAGIVISLAPVSITLFALLMLKERLNLLQWISVFVSISGVILITLAGSRNMDKGHILGIIALLGAVVSAGLYNVLSRKISAKHNPIEITFVMMWAGAIVFNVIGLASAASHGGLVSYFTGFLNTNVIIDILYLGILSSVAAFFLLNYSLSKIEASKAGVLMNLTPVVTVLAGIFLRGEKFYLLQFIGAALILAGIWGTNQRKRQVIKFEQVL